MGLKMVNWFRNRRAEKLLEQAMNAAKVGKYDEAAHIASAALVLQPKNAVAYQQRATWLQLAHQDNDALADYDQALALSPDSASLYVQRGMLKRQTGDYDGAIDDFSAAIARDASSAEAYHARYEAYLATDRLEDALTDLSSAIQYAPRADYYRQRAELYLLSGRRKQALADLDKAVPLLHTAHQQATAAAAQRADTEQARELVGLVREAYLSALIQRAQLRHQLNNDVPSALADIQATLAIDNDFAPAYNARAKISQQQGDRGALQDFLQAIQLDPTHAAYYLNLADLYFLAGAHAEARKVFEELKKRLPDNPIGDMGLIITDYALGRRREAKAAWQALAEKDARLLNAEQLQAIFSNHPRIAQHALQLL